MEKLKRYRVGDASAWDGSDRFTYFVDRSVESGDDVVLTTLDGGYRHDADKIRVTKIYNVRFDTLPCAVERMCWARKVKKA